MRQAQAFYDRGEGVWTDVLRMRATEPRQGPVLKEDAWIADTRTALWHRLGNRFYFRPEVEFCFASPNIVPRPSLLISSRRSAPSTPSLRVAATWR